MSALPLFLRVIIVLLASETLGNGVPIHDVPECVDVVGTAVLVVEIVGVLPDIDPEEWCGTFH